MAQKPRRRTTLRRGRHSGGRGDDYVEAIIDTARSPLVLLDEDLRVRSANRAFYETFRLTPEQTVNRQLFDLGNGQWDIPALRRGLSEILAHERPIEDFRIAHDSPGGGVRAMVLNARLVRLEPGQPRTVLLAIADETARRRAERELLSSEEVCYRRLFETAKDGILLLDGDSGQITHANPYWSHLTGLEAESTLGRRLWDVGVFEDAEVIESLVRELQGRDFMRYEDLRVTRTDGSLRHVELASNVYTLDGRRVIQCIVRDISDRVDLLRRERAARDEAEAANRAKDDFLSILSHELRTPLTAMLGWVRVLRRGTIEPGKTGAALETIERNTRLLAQLIEDLLDVSRIAAGKLTIEMRRVELGQVVTAAAETVGEAADSKGVRLDIQLPDTAIIVQGDRHRLQQVVWNLLSNAVKFTSRGGRVDVRLEGLMSGARIIVSDTGQGIEPHLLPQIFDRFRQGEGPVSRDQRGLGLGLAIVRHLVELHGGRVSAYSAGAGQGAIFTVDLPPGAAPDPRVDGDDEGRERPAEASEVRLDGLRILIVEDEADTRRMLAEVLGGRGADVVHAETGSVGLTALAAPLPHVIISDIGLPGGDGYEFIREVRSRTAERGGLIPALALTAFAREEDVRRALEAGFNLHVAKPIDPAELARLVEQIARPTR